MSKPIIDKQDLLDILVVMRNSKSNERYVRLFVEIIHALVNDFVEIPLKEPTLDDVFNEITAKIKNADSVSIAFFYKGKMYSTFCVENVWSKPLRLYSVAIDTNGALNVDGETIDD